MRHLAVTLKKDTVGILVTETLAPGMVTLLVVLEATLPLVTHSLSRVTVNPARTRDTTTTTTTTLRQLINRHRIIHNQLSSLLLPVQPRPPGQTLPLQPELSLNPHLRPPAHPPVHRHPHLHLNP